MPRITGISALLLLAFTSANLHAESWFGDSLEWMTDDSELVVRGKVADIKKMNQKGSITYYETTLHIYEVLKGKYAKMKINIRSRDGDASLDADVVLFLKRGHDVYPAGDYRREFIHNNWTQRILLYNGNPNGAIVLTKPGPNGNGVPTADLSVLKKPDAIIKAIHERVNLTKKNPPVIRNAEKHAKSGVMMGQLGVILMDVAPGSKVFQTFYGGSSVSLRVPADKSFLPKLLMQIRQYPNPNLVAGLANYPGKKTEKVLRSLLNDKTASQTYDAKGKVVSLQYPVRAAAYGALLRLGVEVPMPVLSRKVNP